MRQPNAIRFPLLVVALLLTLQVKAQGVPTGTLETGEVEEDGLPDGEEPLPELARSWEGAVRILRKKGPSDPAAEEQAAAEIFPDAHKVWMHVYGTDPRPVERARRGVSDWACAAGKCAISAADRGAPPPGTGTGVGQVAANPGDRMLRSIKVQTPTQPLPLTIWRPITKTNNPLTQGGSSISGATTTGQLMFDPVLLGRRNYGHVCAYPPVSESARRGKADDVPLCRGGRPRTPTPDSAEMRLGMQWPPMSEMADFEYLAITDTCGNARVIPFQRSFAVPVFHVASGGCGRPDGRVLRVFPSGGWVRVTAFNLTKPASGNVVSATFRVTVPPLEDLVSANTPPMLFPDPKIDDLVIDCGPLTLKAPAGRDGVPQRRSGELPGQKAPPGKSLPGQKAPPGKSRPGKTAPPGKSPPAEDGPTGSIDDQIPKGALAFDPDAKKGKKGGKKGPPIMRGLPRVLPAKSAHGKPLANESLVLAPEPLWRGNCRVQLRGQTKRRLVAPLAMRIRITRTDQDNLGVILDEPWIITPSNSVFRIPPLGARMDGESRLRIEVYSDPMSTDGNVILLSDAGRLARIENISARQSGELRRLVGSVTVHTAPLCGDANFETVEEAGNCLRGYFTVPAMLATLQVTRAPWVERPLITRSVLSAVGIAFAFDSYDPVERRAFPIAGHVGGFVQDLGDDRLGILSYVGVAPTLPILGEGGNTTSIGLLGGIGMEYVTRNNGPDEGFKPAAFLSIIVQVGQANPAAPSGGQAFGTYTPSPQGPPQVGTY